MRAIILAGGFGQRLQTILPDTPKPMAPIRSKPFLAHLLEYLAKQGVTHVILSVHYLRDSIRDYFQSHYHGITIDYAEEDEPLGTGGAILYALSQVGGNEPVFILNGDTFVKINYSKMYNQHLFNQVSMTMALRHIDNCVRYGKVITENQTVIAFKEKGEVGPGLINAGVYLIHPDLFTLFTLPKQFSFESDFLYPFVHIIRPQVFMTEDYFIDIGVPEDYARAQVEI